MKTHNYKDHFDPDDWLEDFAVRQNSDGSKSFLLRSDPFLEKSGAESATYLSFYLPFGDTPTGLTQRGIALLKALSEQFVSIKEVTFKQNLVTIYLHEQHVNDENSWSEIVKFLIDDNDKHPPSDPLLFSEPFLEIELEIPKKLAAKVGSNSVHFQCVRLLRDASGEDIIRLADIQLGFKHDNQNSSLDRILILLMSHRARGIRKLNQLKEGVFIIPVLRDDDIGSGEGPGLRVFSQYDQQPDFWLPLTLPLTGKIKKDTQVAVIIKTDKQIK